tara:strand:+ start:1283 stop:1468 length:186 start_codon:yes stop_codon:yes gene_type:complete
LALKIREFIKKENRMIIMNLTEWIYNFLMFSVSFVLIGIGMLILIFIINAITKWIEPKDLK